LNFIDNLPRGTDRSARELRTTSIPYRDMEYAVAYALVTYCIVLVCSSPSCKLYRCWTTVGIGDFQGSNHITSLLSSLPGHYVDTSFVQSSVLLFTNGRKARSW